MNVRILSQSLQKNGFALVEVNIATVMAGLFLAAMMITNANILGLVKTAKSTAVASQSVQERVEQLRIKSWAQVTSAAFISGTNCMGTKTSSSGMLAGVSETMTVSPTTGTSAPIKVTRSSNGTVATVSNNTNLFSQQRLVRVDISLSWLDYGSRTRTRETTVLIAKGGISR